MCEWPHSAVILPCTLMPLLFLVTFIKWHKQGHFIKVLHNLGLSICSWLHLGCAFREKVSMRHASLKTLPQESQHVTMCHYFLPIAFGNLAKGGIHQIFLSKGAFISLCNSYTAHDSGRILKTVWKHWLT